MRWWTWWLNKKNREGAEALAGFLKLAGGMLAAAIVVVAGLWGLSPGKDDGHTQGVASLQAGDDNIVNMGGGTQVVAQGGGNVSIGFSEQTFVAMLDKRSAELRADLDRASTAEKQVLQSQIEEVARQKADLDTAYQAALKELADLRTKLAAFEGRVPRDKLDAAQQALARGDRGLADSLLAEIEDESQDAVAVAAEAAFARGEIAAQEIRWADAADQFSKAARLDPTYDSLRNAGTYLSQTGRYAEAIRFQEDLLSLARKDFGPADPKTAAALSNLALDYHYAGDFARAEPLYREALEIDRQGLGSTKPEYANHLNNLAGLLQDAGRPAEAEPLLRQAIGIDRKTLGGDDPVYASHISNLAALLLDTGRPAEAEPLFRAALEIDRKVLGTAHPDYALRLSNLAALLQQTGRPAEAEPLHREALAVTRATLGTAHPRYAARLNNLAALLRDTGRPAEAEPLYREALAIARTSLGTAHPDYATPLNNLALLLQATGRPAEAEPLFREALRIERKALGDSHPNTRVVAQNLLDLLNAARPGDPEIAELGRLLGETGAAPAP